MRVGVLGTGNMGSALINAFLSKISGIEILAFDQNQKACEKLEHSVKILPPSDWFSGDRTTSAVIVAVKPSDVASALNLFSSVKESDLLTPIWISIAAGVSISTFRKSLPSGARICRVMPNTPALVGEGMNAYSLSVNCSKDDSGIVEKLLSACGKVLSVPEKMLNAVTGLSGSGPAYVFLFIEALIEGGVTAGLPYEIARECALQTVVGSAGMIIKTGENPSTLKSKVMSPAGTTASGLLALEENAFKHAVISAVVAATRRSEQLGS